MEEFFQANRAHVFDMLAERMAHLVGSDAPERDEDRSARVHQLALQMINCYRGHTPRIHLYPDAAACLEVLRARHIPLGLITDGLAEVQEKKVQALGLADLFDLIIYTDRLAPERRYWKPSPRAFKLAASYFGVSPQECCYVADNPAKDFAGPASLGMTTIWVRRPGGIYSGFVPCGDTNLFDWVDCQLTTLDHLPSVLGV